MNVIGISASYHESARSLLQDGRLVAAAEEERSTFPPAGCAASTA